ncbi:MAG: metalloregulator ArsR/SmtB family transcription factor [Candidatus Saccharimonadales bacterium]
MPTNDKQAVGVFKKYLPVFNALGSPIRQRIMFLLASGKRRSVIELAAETALSRPAISHHLKILRDAKLVQAEKDGVRLYYRPMFETPLRMSQDFTETLQKIIKEKEHHA